MAVNHFFNKSIPNEQTLIDDLIVESIKINGHDMVYLFRNSPEIDRIFGEDSVPSIYSIGKVIEMYIQSTDGFEGEGDFIAKFGLEVRDNMKLIISKRRWIEEFSGISGGVAPNTAVRPREGDLVYFPLSKGIFEIKFVDHENPFYQLGKNYCYTLSCELATHAGDTYSTGITEIDEAGGGTGQYVQYAIDLILTTGTGSFIEGEQIIQGASTATVLSWTPPDDTKYVGVLRVERVSGIFAVSETNIIGQESLANWVFSAKTMTAIALGTPSSDITQNADFALEISKIVDFTESNPFSD